MGNKLKNIIMEEVAKAIEEAERVYAPSPLPPMPKDDKKKERKKRSRGGKVDHSVSHDDEVSGNMDDFGRIAEQEGENEDEIYENVIKLIDYIRENVLSNDHLDPIKSDVSAKNLISVVTNNRGNLDSKAQAFYEMDGTYNWSDIKNKMGSDQEI